MNKRMMIVLVFLITIAVIMVLCGTLFKVKSIKVDYSVNANYDSRDVIKAADYAMYKNIVTVSKDKITDNVEKNVPYCRVTYIEKIAPGTLLIHTQLRYEILSVKVKGNSGYAILDGQLKVLRVSDDLPTDACFIRGVEVESNVAKAGVILSDKDISEYKLIKDMVALACEQIPTLAMEDRFMTFFRCIDFSDPKLVKVETTESAENAEYFVFSHDDALKHFKEALEKIK